MSPRTTTGSSRSAGGPAVAVEILGEVADLVGGRSDRSRLLLRGVAAGALAGAALAGFVLHRRGPTPRRRRE